MAAFTFIVKESGGVWEATQYGGEHSLTESASSTFDLQRKLVNLALQTGGPNSVSSSFNIITPTSAVAQVILGGGGGGFAAAGSAGATGGAAAPTAAVPVEEEKKEEEKEESDEDMGFSLFD